MPEIVFRADGGATTGLGHLYRCCALSEILGPGFSRTLSTRTSGFNGFAAIGAYFDHIVELPDTMDIGQEVQALAAGSEPDIIVLDGYSFDTAYQRALRQHIDCKLVCVDDIYAYEFLADVIINHAGGITADFYAGSPAARLFLGVSYAIIRPSFGQKGWGSSTRPASKANSILITYGAADPNNQTDATLERLLASEVASYDIHVVVGAANRYKEHLLQRYGKVNHIHFHRNVDALQMLTLMQTCGICIASPSTVSLEYLNTSTGILVSDLIADNQKDFYRYLVSNAFSLSLESFLAAPGPSLQTVDSGRVQQTFDGRSAERLHKIFTELK